jgi:uncharacterized protein
MSMKSAQAELDDKLARMRAHVRALESVAVAFSAGVDSTFVLKVAVDVLGPERVLAVTARSPAVPADELAEAERLAGLVGARHLVVDTHELDNPNYAANPNDRCYYCKRTLYHHLDGVLRAYGLACVVNGTNLDDLGDWRPGLRAASEHAVHAPAADAGLTKADIRALSARLGLPTHDKPASPCLASRVPYGHAVTAAKLRMIERAEGYLRRRFDLRECRVRHYDAFARVEVPVAYLAEVTAPPVLAEIERHFRDIGFPNTEIDPRGFRSGALNEVIAFGTRQDAI